MLSSGKIECSNMSAACRPLRMSPRDYSLLLGGSLVNYPQVLAMYVLIKSAVAGMELTGRYLSLGLINVYPDLGGKFEVFLK